MGKKKEPRKSIWKIDGPMIVTAIVTAFVTAIVTFFATKAFHAISPEVNKVVISDTLRVVEARTPDNTNDSLLYYAISELNRTIRETSQENSSIGIRPESTIHAGREKQGTHSESTASAALIADKDPGETEKGEKTESHYYINRVIEKNGFYKKGYTIGDAGAFYVLEKIPNTDDGSLTFEMRLI